MSRLILFKYKYIEIQANHIYINQIKSYTFKRDTEIIHRFVGICFLVSVLVCMLIGAHWKIYNVDIKRALRCFFCVIVFFFFFLLRLMNHLESRPNSRIYPRMYVKHSTLYEKAEFC